MGKTSNPVEIVLTAIDKVTAPIRHIKASMNGLNNTIGAVRDKYVNLANVGGFHKIRDGFQNLKNGVSGIGSGVGSLVAKFALLTAGAGAALAGIKRFVVDPLDNLRDMGNLTGINIKEIQKWRYAADQAGGSAEEMDSALTNFTRAMGQARAGTGKMKAFLEKANPAFAKQIVMAKDNTEAFEMMMGAIIKVKDPQKRLALSMAAFGPSGEAISRMAAEAQDGKVSIQDLLAEAEKMGLATESDTEAADAFNDSFKKLTHTLQMLAVKVLGPIIPKITEMFERIIAGVNDVKGPLTEFANKMMEIIPQAANGFISVMKVVLAVLSPLVSIVMKVIDVFGASNIAIALTAGVILKTLIPPLWAAMSAITSLGIALLTTPLGWFMLAIAAIAGAAYLIYKNWDVVKSFFIGLWDTLADSPFTWLLGPIGIFIKLADAVMDHWAPIADFFGSLGDKMKAVGGWVGRALGIGEAPTVGSSTARMALEDEAAPSLGAVGVAQQAAVNQTSKTENHLVVDFNNAPKGTRVESKTKDSMLDLSMGWNMGVP